MATLTTISHPKIAATSLQKTTTSQPKRQTSQAKRPTSQAKNKFPTMKATTQLAMVLNPQKNILNSLYGRLSGRYLMKQRFLMVQVKILKMMKINYQIKETSKFHRIK
uniref:Uncharacterized protein n=1 Tax=Cacopsylla melanoneura TaxID=428564 RepID=A0A8D8TLW0_9HEMI